MKRQVLINQTTLEIISVAIGKGKEHDFSIFKKSKIKAVSEIEIIADKGYQGIKNKIANSKTPAKKPRKGKLSPDQKRDNKNQAQVRIKVEHIIRWKENIPNFI